MNDEVFEPKQGYDELRQRLNLLNDHEQSVVLFAILGGFKTSTHKEWGIFRKLVNNAIDFQLKCRVK